MDSTCLDDFCDVSTLETAWHCCCYDCHCAPVQSCVASREHYGLIHAFRVGCGVCLLGYDLLGYDLWYYGLLGYGLLGYDLWDCGVWD